MFKHILFVIAILLPCLMAAQEQAPEKAVPKASSYFAKAPADVIVLIPESTRLDMIDYFNAGIQKASVNDTNGECTILDMTDDMVRFSEAEGCVAELFLLNPESKSPLVGVIRTLDTPIPDSSLKVYRSDWTPVASIKVDPSLADWAKTKKAADLADISRVVPFVLASFSYDPATGILEVKNNMNEYFAPGRVPQQLSMLKDSLSYKWTGKNFKLRK